jgi:hypothetical protein
MTNRLLALGLVVACSAWGATPAGAAAVRNVYFTNGETVRGQLYRSEGELPGPTKDFTKGTDKAARLFVIFGDQDAHKVTGTLTRADGTVVSRLNRDFPSYTGAVNVRWRLFSHSFTLERLGPGAYQLELVIDDHTQGTYGFTLR